MISLHIIPGEALRIYALPRLRRRREGGELVHAVLIPVGSSKKCTVVLVNISVFILPIYNNYVHQ